MEPGADETPVGEILLYTAEDGGTRLECRFVDETLWMGQSTLAELLQKAVRTINEHLKNLFAEGELDPEATIRKFRIVHGRATGRIPGALRLCSTLPTQACGGLPGTIHPGRRIEPLPPNGARMCDLGRRT